MSPQFHHLWRSYLGQTLYVSIGRQTFHGVLVGLQPVMPTASSVPEESQPWAIDTPHGIELVDPDNPAVSIFDSGGPVTSYPPKRALTNRQVQIAQMFDAYQRAAAAAARARQLHDQSVHWTTKS